MSISKLRICYFEDDPQHREVVGKHLSLDGYIVDLCSDGASAIAAAKARRPDVILADILMPGMNGIATIKSIREEGIDSPAIVLTNFEKNDIDGGDLRDLNIAKILLKADTSLDEISEAVADVGSNPGEKLGDETSN